MVDPLKNILAGIQPVVLNNCIQSFKHLSYKKKSAFGFKYWIGQTHHLAFNNILWKNPNKSFGPPNISKIFYS